MASGKNEQWALMALGVILIVLAIVFRGATGAGLAVVGAFTIIFGIVRTSLEGNVKIGPGGFEATFARELKAEIEKQAEAGDIPRENVQFATDVLAAAESARIGSDGLMRASDAARRVLEVARRRPYQCGQCGQVTIFPDTGMASPVVLCSHCGNHDWHPLTMASPPD